MRAVPAALVLLAVVVATTGCSGGPAPEPSTGPTAAPSPTDTPLDFELPDDDEEPYPEWDETSRQQAVATGDATMGAFVRPAAAAQESAWWEGLAPLLTPAAQDAYLYVDPVEVPATAVTGPAVLVEPEPGTTAFLATVQVPTDVGTYDVLLARTGGGAPWLAERITPPESLSVPADGPSSPDTPA